MEHYLSLSSPSSHLEAKGSPETPIIETPNESRMCLPLCLPPDPSSAF